MGIASSEEDVQPKVLTESELEELAKQKLFDWIFNIVMIIVPVICGLAIWRYWGDKHSAGAAWFGISVILVGLYLLLWIVFAIWCFLDWINPIFKLWHFKIQQRKKVLLVKMGEKINPNKDLK